jgi:glycosyltransferase involved in cell wall biosynthesis
MFPSARSPAFGPFVADHARLLRETHREELDLRATVIRDPRKGWRTPVKYASFAIRAWGQSLTRRFDVVHVHYAYPTAIGAWVALRRGAKLVITAHGGDVNEMLPRRAPQATRRAFLRADHIIAVSSDIERKLRDRLGDACPEISVANMGVDTSRFRHAPATAPGRPARLLFVGQLIERKGVDVLLRAASRLPMDWRLEVVGNGLCRAALVALSGELALAGRVTFHGALPPERLPGLYREADLFVGPSREEPLGLVFLEAAASGCPLVATGIGGIRELFTDEDTALLVPPDDAEALAAAMGRVLTDFDLRTRLVEGALAVALQNSAHESVRHTVDVYREVFSDR